MLHVFEKEGLVSNHSVVDTLLERLTNKTARIGIVGLGYVGLPLMLRYVEVGYPVVGFDIDESKVNKLCCGQSYIQHISYVEIDSAFKKKLEVTTDFSSIQNVDAIILCVPTPLNPYREPDLSYVLGTMDSLLPYLHAGQVVSLESTTYPGATEEELLPRMQSCGLTVGQDAFLVFSPEREDPGNSQFKTHTIPKVCGGYSAACLKVGIALYEQVIERVIPVSSTRAAELTKLLENIHRAVNIGLANEMKIIADKMDIDIHEVIRAAATKPFGFVPYYPGPGLGGHCIPIDPFYLTWKARQYGLHTRFIELAGEVNAGMPDYVISKLTIALNQLKKSVNGSQILVLGIAYKKNVDDMRESPAVELMHRLSELGAIVHYSDPYIPRFPKMRKMHFQLSSIDLTPTIVAEFDCILLATDHDQFDYDMIKKHARLIVDTRGRYLEKSEHIVKA